MIIIDVLTIGEPLVLYASQEPDVSLVDATHFIKRLAGAEINVAIGLSRLGHQVGYLTQLGSDPNGQYILKQLQHHQIDTALIHTDPACDSGLMFKNQVTSGDPDIYYYRAGSAASHLGPEALDLAVPSVDFKTLRYVHLTGIFAGLSADTYAATMALVKHAHDAGVPVIFDPNLRPSLWPSKTTMVKTLAALAAQADIVLPGVSEGAQLSGHQDVDAIADFFLREGTATHTVILKTGEHGAFIKTHAGTRAQVPGFKAQQVLDTVGAGDGFAVGLISGLLDHLPLPEAVAQGNAIGALAVQSLGDNEGYPTREQLKHFMGTH